MQQPGVAGANAQLKQMVAEASRSLAQLDSARLEELAVSCRAFNRDLKDADEPDWVRIASESRDAAPEMAIFERVLEVTRRNLEVLNRLREQHTGRIEYSERQARGWAQVESRNGDN